MRLDTQSIRRPKGLSPRVRGNRRVYPRVCGGTLGAHRAKIPRQGLSPRVRGNRSPNSSVATERGSIPACAGEPGLDIDTIIQVGVYPRVCGGTLSTEHPTTPKGLSPRVRGNRR